MQNFVYVQASLGKFWATNELMKILLMFLGVVRFVHFGAGCDGASGGDTTAAIDGDIISCFCVDIIISEFVIEFCRPSPRHPLQADAVRHTTEA